MHFLFCSQKIFNCHIFFSKEIKETIFIFFSNSFSVIIELVKLNLFKIKRITNYLLKFLLIQESICFIEILIIYY